MYKYVNTVYYHINTKLYKYQMAHRQEIVNSYNTIRNTEIVNLFQTYKWLISVNIVVVKSRLFLRPQLLMGNLPNIANSTLLL